MKFKVTYKDQSINVIHRSCKEDVEKFLKLGGVDLNDVIIEPIDFYQELQIIGLTHDQCSEVIELLETYNVKI